MLKCTRLIAAVGLFANRLRSSQSQSPVPKPRPSPKPRRTISGDPVAEAQASDSVVEILPFLGTPPPPPPPPDEGGEGGGVGVGFIDEVQRHMDDLDSARNSNSTGVELYEAPQTHLKKSPMPQAKQVCFLWTQV